jgi:hypothetical protein
MAGRTILGRNSKVSFLLVVNKNVPVTFYVDSVAFGAPHHVSGQVGRDLIGGNPSLQLGLFEALSWCHRSVSTLLPILDNGWSNRGMTREAFLSGITDWKII